MSVELDIVMLLTHSIWHAHAHREAAARIVDLCLSEGSSVLFRIALAALALHEREIEHTARTAAHDASAGGSTSRAARKASSHLLQAPAQVTSPKSPSSEPGAEDEFVIVSPMPLTRSKSGGNLLRHRDSAPASSVQHPGAVEATRMGQRRGMPWDRHQHRDRSNSADDSQPRHAGSDDVAGVASSGDDSEDDDESDYGADGEPGTPTVPFGRARASTPHAIPWHSALAAQLFAPASHGSGGAAGSSDSGSDGSDDSDASDSVAQRGDRRGRGRKGGRPNLFSEASIRGSGLWQATSRRARGGVDATPGRALHVL